MEPLTDLGVHQVRRVLAKLSDRLDGTPPCRAADALRAVSALLDRSGPLPTVDEVIALLQLIEEDLEKSNVSAGAEG